MKDITSEAEGENARAGVVRGNLMIAGAARWQSSWVVPTIASVILLAQLLFSVQRLSITSDEALHLTAGYRNLACGDYSHTPEHPPLLRKIAATPLVLSTSDKNCSYWMNAPVDASVLSGSRTVVESALLRARTAAAVFAVGLCFLIWIAARDWFGATVALVATSLYVFEPNVLANGALITTDLAVTAMFACTVYAFYRVTEGFTPLSIVMAGLATGLTLTAKLSGIAIIPVLVLLAIVDSVSKKLDLRSALLRIVKNLSAVGAVIVVAGLVVWAMYGFKFSLRPSDGAASSSSAQLQGRGMLLDHHLLPESYLAGMQNLSSMTGAGAPSVATGDGVPRPNVSSGGDSGRPAFLYGKLYPSGRWFYFPAASLIKLTGAVLVLIVLSVPGVWWLLRRTSSGVWWVSIPAGIYLALCMHSHLNIGYRHVLPVLPFVLILIAAGSVELAHRVPKIKYAVGALLVLHAASSLIAFPNYLSYGNEFAGGSTQTYKYLTDSNTDWGQALKQLEAYTAEHSVQPCWVALFPGVDASGFHFPCQQIFQGNVPRNVQGTVIVSSFWLSGVGREAGLPALAPFDAIRPSDTIGGSAMLVYHGNFEMRVPAGVSEAMLARTARESGKWDEAFVHAQKAVELIPEMGIAHAELCVASLNSSRVQSAGPECRQALSMLRQDAYYSRRSFTDLSYVLREYANPD